MAAFLRWLVATVACLWCFARPAAAAEPSLTVSVLTMGPGDPTFSKFGHNAIVIKHTRSGRSTVYNFGTFTFSSPNLVSDFLNRKLNYWLSVEPFAETLHDYRAQNRTLIEQELALTPAQALVLSRALIENARPENRLYRYDYFIDNCSTRVRDALDRVLDGQLQRAARSRVPHTFRDHSLRLTADDPALYLGLDFGLSGYADRPLTVWDDAFLPQRLSELLRSARVRDASGELVPLVRAEHVHYRAERAPVPAEPPQRLFYLLLLGIAGGAVLALLRARRDRLSVRIAYSGLLTVLGLVVGGAGSLLGFFWLATAHEAAWRNVNLLLAPPWALLLLLVAAGNLRASPWADRLLRAVSLLTLACGVAALGLRLSGLAEQHTERIMALMLPLWVGLGWHELRAFATARRRSFSSAAEQPQPSDRDGAPLSS